jgi:TrmH family RNA methyltransferase
MRFVAVLVDPARPVNVGAAARALKNFGGELRVVRGRHALPGGEGHAEARALAWNAQDVLDAASHHDDLAAAITDASLSASSSGRLDPGRDVLTPRQLAAEAAALPHDAVVACVFGSEESGLDNAELDACRTRLRIPTRAEQPSLNLAQSVVVVAYEMSLAHAPPAPAPVAAAGDEPAREEDVARLAVAFEELASRSGYLNPQSPEHVMGELRRLLGRARPSRREITLLMGLVAQLRWAQDHLPRGS